MRKYLLAFVLCCSVQASLYQDKRAGLQFEYGADWQIAPLKKDTSMPHSKEETIVTLQKANSEEGYRPQVSFVLEPIKAGTDKLATQAAYEKRALEFLKNQGFQILAQSAKVMPGFSTPVFLIEASHRNFGLTLQQLVIVRGENAFLVTAAAKSAFVEKNKADWAPIFESIKLN